MVVQHFVTDGCRYGRPAMAKRGPEGAQCIQDDGHINDFLNERRRHRGEPPGHGRKHRQDRQSNSDDDALDRDRA